MFHTPLPLLCIAAKLMRSSERTRFFPPFNINQFETACNNAKKLAKLFGLMKHIQNLSDRVRQSSDYDIAVAAPLNDLCVVNNVATSVLHIASEAYIKLANFIADFMSLSGFLMGQEELVIGFSLTREWLDIAV